METENIDFHIEIKNRCGGIKRARGYYLYTEKNIRLIDMYLDGGRAILGRRSGKNSLVFKQCLDKGLTGDFPTSADFHLEKILKTFFPSYSFGIYSNKEKAEAALREILSLNTNERIPVFMPFSEEPLSKGFLVFPYMSINTVIAVCSNECSRSLPPSDKIFPAEKAAIARFFSDLQKALNNEQVKISKELKSQKTKPSVSSLIKNLKPNLEKIWTLKGRYLFPKCAETEYEKIFTSALNNKIFISPYFYTPSVFPILDSYSELLSFLKEV